MESAVASSLASLPPHFENAKLYTNAMVAYVNATKPYYNVRQYRDRRKLGKTILEGYENWLFHATFVSFALNQPHVY